MEPNPDFQTEQDDEIMASEPVSLEPLEPIAVKEEIPAETIEILDKNRILSHIKPQENKYWHFTFNTDSNKNQLTSVIQSIPGYSLTVEYGLPQNTPDITLKRDGKIVGKIHLLLCDRRDANLPNKYYCKIYFYHFDNEKLYQDVKAAVINFFENFKSVSGGKQNIRHRTITNRKRTNKIRTNKKRIKRRKTLRRK
jgi:hypothetical protein